MRLQSSLAYPRRSNNPTWWLPSLARSKFATFVVWLRRWSFSLRATVESLEMRKLSLHSKSTTCPLTKLLVLPGLTQYFLLIASLVALRGRSNIIQLMQLPTVACCSLWWNRRRIFCCSCSNMLIICCRRKRSTLAAVVVVINGLSRSEVWGRT